MPYKDKAVHKAKVKEYRQNNLKQYAEKQAQYYDDNPDKYLVIVAKTRAKKNGIPFDLKAEDITVPTHCPVLGIPLSRGTKGFHESSPSLDRIIPEKGYVKGNVIVVSFKANRMKQNATVEELGKLYFFYKNLEKGEEIISSPSS